MLVVIHSTIHPETPAQLAADAPANVTVLDAPVSGTRTRAESADLAFMVGGNEQALDYVRPYLDSMGATVHALGEVGSGEVAKIQKWWVPDEIIVDDIPITGTGKFNKNVLRDQYGDVLQ